MAYREWRHGSRKHQWRRRGVTAKNKNAYRAFSKYQQQRGVMKRGGMAGGENNGEKQKRNRRENDVKRQRRNQQSGESISSSSIGENKTSPSASRRENKLARWRSISARRG